MRLREKVNFYFSSIIYNVGCKFVIAILMILMLLMIIIMINNMLMIKS